MTVATTTRQVVCQNCQRQPATVTRRVLTKGKATQTRHECVACAEKRSPQRYGSKKRMAS